MILRRYRLGIAVVLVLCLARAESAPAQPDTPALAGEAGDDALFGRTITRIQFRGNRKVEDDAIRVNLRSKVGDSLKPETVRSDLRAMWKMGFFDDIVIEAEPEGADGVVLIFAINEKPSIRKVLISGNEEIDLEKINEVLDLKRDTILDVGKVKQNREKIARSVRGEGLLPGVGRLRDPAGQPGQGRCRPGRGRCLVHHRRALKGRDPRHRVRRQRDDLRRRAARHHRDQHGRRAVVPHRRRHLPARRSSSAIS